MRSRLAGMCVLVLICSSSAFGQEGKPSRHTTIEEAMTSRDSSGPRPVAGLYLYWAGVQAVERKQIADAELERAAEAREYFQGMFEAGRTTSQAVLWLESWAARAKREAVQDVGEVTFEDERIRLPEVKRIPDAIAVVGGRAYRLHELKERWTAAQASVETAEKLWVAARAAYHSGGLDASEVVAAGEWLSEEQLAELQVRFEIRVALDSWLQQQGKLWQHYGVEPPKEK